MCASVLFPNTSYAPGTVQAATGISGSPQLRVYRGWPLANVLDADSAAGISHVSLFTPPGAARTEGHKYFDDWIVTTNNTPTLTVAVNASTILFSGTGGLVGSQFSQVAGVQIGSNDSLTASYVVSPTDTPATVAAALAALLPNATASGSTITVTTSVPTTLSANVVAAQAAYNETRRQSQLFRLIIWGTSDSIRDAIGGALDSAMAAVRSFALPDGDTTSLPQYHGTMYNDLIEKARLWRRDLIYDIEYATTNTQTFIPLLFPGGTLTSTIVGSPTATGIFGGIHP